MTVRPRVLVCGWSGAGNLGDELLTEVVVDRLRDAGLAPVVRSVAPELTVAAHPGVEVAGRGLASIRSALSVDAVVLGPGGIVQDHTSVWSLPAHLVPALIARLRRRPVVGLGLGADPLRRRLSRVLVRLALRGSPVVVRDELSAGAMRGAGVDAEIDLDLAWELGHPEPVAGLGLTVAIGPVAGSGAWRPGRRRLVPDDPAPVIAAIERLHDEVGGPVRLVAFRGARDEEFARRLAGKLTAAELVPADRAVDAVRGAAAVLTSRYHAALVAVAAGVPVLADVRQAKLAALAATEELTAHVRGFDSWAGIGSPPTAAGAASRSSTGATDAAVARLAQACRLGPA
ncbi:MAG: polysaccharide pyruvyl transferase family protein [Actinomycetota bacterium]